MTIAAPSETPKPEMMPGQVYRRLLSYAWPYRGTFFIGVIGMALFAATDGSLALFVKQFVDGTFFEKNTRVRPSRNRAEFVHTLSTPCA